MMESQPSGSQRSNEDRSMDYFHLRTQWLQYRSRLFDFGMGLPTLPAVFDDLRRLIEERGSVLLIYIDLSRENRMEEIWGWQTYDAILKEFGGVLSRAQKSLLPPESMLCLMSVRGDEFLVVIPPQEKSRQEVSFRIELETQAEEFSNVIGYELARLPLEAHSRQLRLATGSAFVQLDPMQRLERQLHRAINEARLQFERRVEQDESSMRSVLKNIIREKNVRTLFQPIVYTEDGSILGYEALSRGPESVHFKDTETLFTFADKSELGVALDRLCRITAVRSASNNGSRRLFLNTSAKAIRDPSFVDEEFVGLIHEKGMHSKNIVFEITERVKIEEWDGFRKIVEHLRKHDFCIAIDDMGSGYSSLKSIAELEPEFLKFDMSLVHNIDKSLIKQDLLKVILGVSDKLGAPIIAEGVETREEYHVLLRLGVKLAQGNFFAMPGEYGAPLLCQLT